MRRLASPSVLFAVWTLLFALPALPLLFRHVPVSVHGAHHAASASAMHTFSAVRVVAPLLAAMPISFPGFAIVFALWPRIAGRPLDAALGRWQFALATVPGFVSVFVTAAIVAWIRTPSGVDASNSMLPAITITTLYVVIGFWLVSLAVFVLNVSRSRQARSL